MPGLAAFRSERDDRLWPVLRVQASTHEVDVDRFSRRAFLVTWMPIAATSV